MNEVIAVVTITIIAVISPGADFAMVTRNSISASRSVGFFTALGISLGLSMMMLSPLNIHFNVSVLMWVSMIVSVLVTLSLLPTIYRFEKKVK